MAKKRFKTVDELEDAWEAYKDNCDNQMVLAHEFSSKNSEFVSQKIKKSITYTIEGFCVFSGISRQAFYKHYAVSKRYVDTVTRMREECEFDARRKFETGCIPTQLAALWMSNYGYSTKEKTIIAADNTSNILEALGGKAKTVFAKDEDEEKNE